MTNAQKEELAQEAIRMYEEGIDIQIPRKNAIMLFGAVIAANVATVFVLQSITMFTKRLVTVKVEQKDDESGSVD